MQLRQEQSFKSVPKPSSREKGKKPATGRPSTSRRLFVPSSEERHQEYQVYSDCRDTLNDRHKEYRTSPILPILQSASSSKRLTILRKNITKLEYQLGERYNQDQVQALRISFYIRVEDPVTHIHNFQSALGCKVLTDEGQCLLFPSTLARAALNWFYRLEPTDHLYSIDDLYTIRQRDDEPLREYAAKFSYKYSRCPEIDDRVAFGTFKSGLRAQPLTPRNSILTPKEYLQYPLAQRQMWGRQDGSKHNKDSSGRNDFRSSKEARPEEAFTLLNSTYEYALMAENQMIPKPSNQKLPRQINKDTGVFC
ncbi:unnamed protein product [Prunus armeniaca]